MKRFLSFMLALLLVVGFVPCSARAAETDGEIICFDDGSYLVSEVVVMETRASGSITGSKPYTYYGGDGTALWKATLKGSFNYTGTSATCNSSSVSVTIYNSSWSTVSKSASKSGNTATASVTMAMKVSGVTVTSVPVSMSLKCDANGILS